VSVLAGSGGSDPAGRVAYVKTVHQADANAGSAATPIISAAPPYNELTTHDSESAAIGSAAPGKHLLVSADVNATQQVVFSAFCRSFSACLLTVALMVRCRVRLSVVCLSSVVCNASIVTV